VKRRFVPTPYDALAVCTTPGQRLAVLALYEKAHSYTWSPLAMTIRQFAEAGDLRLEAATRLLEALERNGLISWERGTRGIPSRIVVFNPSAEQDRGVEGGSVAEHNEQPAAAVSGGERNRDPRSAGGENGTARARVVDTGAQNQNRTEQNNCPSPNPRPGGAGAMPVDESLVDACAELLANADEKTLDAARRRDSALGKRARKQLEKQHRLPARTRSDQVADALAIAAGRPRAPRPSTPAEPEPPPPPSTTPARSRRWDEARAALHRRIGHQDVEIWFSSAVLVDDCRLWLPNEHYVEWIAENYLADLAVALAIDHVELVTGHPAGADAA
jgi:hypothetical protein